MLNDIKKRTYIPSRKNYSQTASNGPWPDCLLLYIHMIWVKFLCLGGAWSLHRECLIYVQDDLFFGRLNYKSELLSQGILKLIFPHTMMTELGRITTMCSCRKLGCNGVWQQNFKSRFCKLLSVIPTLEVLYLTIYVSPLAIVTKYFLLHGI